jgi:amidohydrolase
VSRSVFKHLESSLPELVAIRRDLHAHPELGMHEVRTSALVANKLQEWGVEFVTGVGKTGVVATIHGDRFSERSIGLRADMDALTIHERTGLPYASVYPDKMHACGHDGHTAMLLGAARYLSLHPDFSGTVHLIFQPAEEGGGGANAMIEDGLFVRFACNSIYGLHAMPGIPAGHFAIRPGPFFASVCPWRVIFRGTGGHGGAAPHKASDITVVLGQFLQAVHTIVGRNLSATDTAVVSVGYVTGGSSASPSVMPDEISVGGTARCFTTEVADIISRRLSHLAHASAAAYECTAEVDIVWRAPPLVNSSEQFEIAVAAAAAVSGAAAVDANAKPLTAGEDFSRMLKDRPGAFILIGNGAAHDDASGLHTPLFDFNDEIISVGIAYWAAVVDQELGPRAASAGGFLTDE